MKLNLSFLISTKIHLSFSLVFSKVTFGILLLTLNLSCHGDETECKKQPIDLKLCKMHKNICSQVYPASSQGYILIN